MAWWLTTVILATWEGESDDDEEGPYAHRCF
jgi:hypothetical protein